LTFKLGLEGLLGDLRLGVLSERTAQWLSGLGDETYSKLAAQGLVAPRQATPAQAVRLVAFGEGWIESRVDTKASTRSVLKQTVDSLREFFGPEKLLTAATEADVTAFRIFLTSTAHKGKPYAAATVTKRMKVLKQILGDAVDARLIAKNPVGKQKNRNDGDDDSRFHSVSLEELRRVLEACPSVEWKLLFAFARIGALRIPSETFGLRWEDCHWEAGTITVRSPKTAHHGGKHAERLIPMWPELRHLLLLAHERAPVGSAYVFEKYRDSAANLRTHGERIVRRAGLTPWAKLWQNCRVTRENELCQTWPEHLVAKWVGHSRAVAREFYLKALPSDFERAATWSTPVPEAMSTCPSEPGRIPGQSEAISPCDSLQEGEATGGENAVLQGVPGDCKSLQDKRLAPRGFEPLLSG